MSYRVQTGRTNAYLNSRRPFADFQVEMVTDEHVLIMLTAPLTEKSVDSLVWQLAHLVDAVALFAEEKTGNPFRSFTVLFENARFQIGSRRLATRKESAEIPALPDCLGGSEEPSKE